MSLRNQNWTDLSGNPITGRVPPRLVSMNGVQPSVRQMGMIAHHYKLLTYMVTVSIIPYLVQERTLLDGTRIRMVSSYGVDTVYVWPTGGDGKSSELAHGFLVEASWIDPQILGKAPKNLIWRRVPQAKGGVSAYNQIVLTTTNKGKPRIHVLPLVRSGGVVWDFRAHKTEGPAWLPFALKSDASPQRLDYHPAHFSNGHVIIDEKGAVLLTGSEPNQVGENDEGFYPLPAFTDGKAGHLGLQAYREAEVRNQKRMAFVYDKVKRLGKKAYAIEATTKQQLSFPVSMPMENSTFTASNLGETPSGDLKAIYIKGDFGARSWGTYIRLNTGGLGVISENTISFMHDVIEEVVSPPIINTADAFRLEITEVRAPTQRVEDLIAVASADEHEFIAWEHEVSYPSVIYRRGGTETAGYEYDPFTSYLYSGGSYGVSSMTYRRGNCDWSIVTPVSSRFDLNWRKLAFFEGDVAGVTTGFNYIDSSFRKFRTTHFTLDVVGNTDAATPGTVPEQYYPPYNPNSQPGDIVVSPDLYSSAAYAGDLRPKWLALAAEYAVNGGHKEENVGYAAQTNTVSYSLKSRHVIDYDHRGRFYAALRVEVACTGALWRNTPPDIIGSVRKISDPNYTVKIYFEVGWNQETDSLLLLESSCTREMFEVTEIRISNPYYYPSPNDQLDILIRMPPLITPPIEAMRQLYNLAGHQGVNPHIACQDIETQAPYNDPQHISSTGVEFSYIKDGQEIAPSKYAPGCLYARTFKVGDFADALWLLFATQCDAPLNNARNVEPPLPLWHYMPDLKEGIENQVFHIEARNGKIGQWSHLLKGKKAEGQNKEMQRPSDPKELKIKLHKV